MLICVFGCGDGVCRCGEGGVEGVVGQVWRVCGESCTCMCTYIIMPVCGGGGRGCRCGRGRCGGVLTFVHVLKHVWVPVHTQILKTENFQITCKLFKEITNDNLIQL